MSLNPPTIHAILQQLGPHETETVIVEGHTFLIHRPSRSDGPFDGLPGYTPFWADIWPAARMLAKVIQRQTWTPDAEVIELGCGLGLPGIVALARGLRVTFSDRDPCALH